MYFSRTHFRNCICVLFLMNWLKYKHFRSSLHKVLHLIHLSSFIVSIQVLNSGSSHLVFSGGRARFQVFLVKKICFSVLVLISIKVKDCSLLVVKSFISWIRFLFCLEFKFKEKSFRVYRGQWDILIILPKMSVLLGFGW